MYGLDFAANIVTREPVEGFLDPEMTVGVNFGRVLLADLK
jgi:hypothetical protein